jgi:hypothetical protein
MMCSGLKLRPRRGRAKEGLSAAFKLACMGSCRHLQAWSSKAVCRHVR